MAEREAIVVAAAEVVLRDGIQGCTVRAIAARASVSKGSVHYYFADVDEIVDAAVLRAVSSWIEHVRRRPPVINTSGRSGPLDRISAAFERWFAGTVVDAQATLVPLLLEYSGRSHEGAALLPLRGVQRLLEQLVLELLSSAGVTGAPFRGRHHRVPPRRGGAATGRNGEPGRDPA